ncbi:hypothetical protein V6N13_132250 [Hibiscus sabdariffa]
MKEVNDGASDQFNDDDSDEYDDPREAELWKKRSIFFKLPYWKHHILRHNLDVMHIEKNVCENIIWTILNVDTKSKDNLQSRLDLVDIGIRHALHPHCMTNEVTSCMIELSNIMKFICGKVLVVEELEQLQDRVSLTLCNLKKIFPPSFFTIMVHLLVHLPQEAKVGGPVFYRWMYPIERFLDKLKSYCRNKRYPEGSITEGYLADECLTFCSRYLEDVDTTFNRPNKNDLFVTNELAQTYLFGSYGEPIDKIQIEELDDMSWVQAHQYVLFHHDSIDSLRTAFLRSSARSRKVNQRGIDKLFTETFHEWLGQTVWSGREVSDDVKWLCQGPNRIVKRYSGFLINGFKFHTKTRERLRKTHNCGVVVTSSTTSYASARDNCLVEGDVEYYGILTDIIELEYYGKRKVVSFCCVWIDVNTTRDLGWYVVLRNTPRHLIDIGDGGKMPRRKLTSLRTIRDPPLEEEINVHEKTGDGSTEVPETLKI